VKDPDFKQYVLAACTPFATFYVAEHSYDKKADEHTIGINSNLRTAIRYPIDEEFPDWADNIEVNGVLTPLWAVPLDSEGKAQKRYAQPTFPDAESDDEDDDEEDE